SSEVKHSGNKRLPYDWKDKLFDPNFDVDRSNGGKSLTAYYNLVCCVSGTGMLSLSSVLAKAGWSALALLIICWWMTSYSSDILVKCLYYGGSTRAKTVHEIAERAFGRTGGYLSLFFNAWILLGTPIIYFVLIGENMNQLCTGTVAEIGETKWSIIFIVSVAIPFVFMKTFDNLQWTSFVGSVAMVATTLICVIVPAQDLSNQIDVVHEDVIWVGWKGAVATIAYSLGGNVVYPNCEAAMKRPQQWTLVCHFGMATCALLYIMIAIPGYYVYGEAVQNPIYNSMPFGVGRTISIVLVTINCLFSAPIFAGSFALDLEIMMGISVDRLGKTKEFIYRVVWRVFLIGVCGMIACIVPHFNELQSLFGAIGYSTSIFLIPILCFWKLTGIRNKPIYEIVGGLLTLIMGIVGLVFGTWESVKGLIEAYSE
ncbi:hypothetical protein INT45_007941, partial [Circinella minor]